MASAAHLGGRVAESEPRRHKVRDSSIPRPTFEYIASLEWVHAKENVLLVGPSGTGKSHALVGCGVHAVERGMKVRYLVAADLIETLYRGLADNTVGKVISGLLRNELILIDELGFAPLDDTGSQLMTSPDVGLAGAGPEHADDVRGRGADVGLGLTRAVGLPPSFRWSSPPTSARRLVPVPSPTAAAERVAFLVSETSLSTPATCSVRALVGIVKQIERGQRLQCIASRAIPRSVVLPVLDDDRRAVRHGSHVEGASRPANRFATRRQTQLEPGALFRRALGVSGAHMRERWRASPSVTAAQ